MASHHHLRSNSLPTQSHPLAKTFEDELNNMKRWASSAEASTSQQSLCQGLEGLAKLHSCIGNLLKMPNTQRAIGCYRNEKWLAEELDGSVRLLDMCTSTRDSLSLLKEQAQDLQSTLRTKRAGDKKFQSIVQTCASSCKKTIKEVCKCIKELKTCSPNSDIVNHIDEDLCLVVRAFKEVREITNIVYNSLFSFIASKQASGYWSLVSKAMNGKHKTIAAATNSITASFLDLCKSMSTKDVDVSEAQKQIKELECEVGTVENGLEFLFQGLIRNRVALLNIVNM